MRAQFQPMLSTLRCGEFECETAAIVITTDSGLADAMLNGWVLLTNSDSTPTSEQLAALEVAAALRNEPLPWVCPDCVTLRESR